MTDMDNLIELLGGWGVPRRCTANWSGYGQEQDGNMAVIVENDLEGHHSLFTKFVFAPNGQFISMGAWE